MSVLCKYYTVRARRLRPLKQTVARTCTRTRDRLIGDACGDRRGEVIDDCPVGNRLLEFDFCTGAC